MATTLDPLKKKPAATTTGLGTLSTPNEAGQTGGFAAALDRTQDPRLGSSNAAEVLAGISSQDSTLMQHAKTRGTQVANRRGLVNSTIAGQAQQAAMMDYALPLAQSVSDTNAQREFQETEQDWRSGESALDREAAQKAQETEQKWRTSEAELDREATRIAQMTEQDWRSSEADLERDMKLTLANMEIDQANQRSAEEQVYRYHSLYQNTVANILANPNLSSSERKSQISAAKSNLNDQMRLSESLLSIDIPWDFGMGSGSAPAETLDQINARLDQISKGQQQDNRPPGKRGTNYGTGSF